MKAKALILLTAFLMFTLTAAAGQPGSAGVKFEQASFKDVLAKAQKENKIVLVDFYTDT